MKKPFRVILKVKDQYIIREERKPKDVDEWFSTYYARQEIEEISVYQQDGLAFNLIAHEHKRRIGF
jgi:hypothetical protein